MNNLVRRTTSTAAVFFVAASAAWAQAPAKAPVPAPRPFPQMDVAAAAVDVAMQTMLAEREAMMKAALDMAGTKLAAGLAFDQAALAKAAQDMAATKLAAGLAFDDAAVASAAQDAARAGIEAGGAFGQESRDRQAEREAAARARALARQAEGRDREHALYEKATAAMDAGRWETAKDAFADVAAMKGERADAALYWMAYSQNKLGQRAEALETIVSLTKNYAESRWLSDAKALEVEIRGALGQPVRPETESDDELKVLALNSLMATDSEQAIAMLQKMLQSQQSPKVKKRALFVLSQNPSPKAREAVLAIAKGASNPDLQEQAITYLGMTGAKENRQVLADIYASTQSKDIKRRILQAYMVGGERDRLLAVAKGEADPDLRREAIRQLGVMHGTDQLWQMYQAEKMIDVKREIIRAMFMSSDVDHVMQLAKSESDLTLRREAVRSLGLMRRESAGDELTGLYWAAGQPPEVRREVVNALFIQGNAKALVAIARKETDPGLKKDIVSRLSMMKSKEATDYLMELINK